MIDATAAPAEQRVAAPRRWRLLRGEPAYVICLILFLAANAFSGNLTGLPLPVGPDRILFGLFVLFLLLDRRVSWSIWRPGLAGGVALVTVVWIALSAQWHGTLTTSLGAFALLDRVAIPYLLFAVAPIVFATRYSRVLLLKFLVLLGLYLGAMAIFQVLGPHALVFPKYIADPNVGITPTRARGPFLASDADAATMATCFFAAAGLYAVERSLAWRRLAGLSIALCVVGVFLAQTRAEWVGAAVGAVVAGLLVPSVRRKIPLIAASVAVLIAVLLVASPTLRSDVADRTADSRSVYDRQNTDDGGLRALASDPLFGIGWEEFLGETDHFVRQADSYPLTNTHIEVHNVPLSRFAELGLLGGGLWLLSVLLGPVSAMFVRRRADRLDEAYRVAFVGSAIVWLVAMQLSPFPYPLPNALIWLLAGVVLTPLQAAARQQRSMHYGRRAARHRTGAGGAALNTGHER